MSQFILKEVVLVPCAIIECDHNVFSAQRNTNVSLPLKWEFPGGKLENNESVEEGLAREIMEELSVQIHIGAKLQTTVRDDVWREIHLIPFICHLLPGQEIVLTEHAQGRWLSPSELYDVDWAIADLDVVKNYLTYLKEA